MNNVERAIETFSVLSDNVSEARSEVLDIQNRLQSAYYSLVEAQEIIESSGVPPVEVQRENREILSEWKERRRELETELAAAAEELAEAEEEMITFVKQTLHEV